MKRTVKMQGARRRGAVPAWVDRRVLLVLGLLAVLVAAGYAAAPSWWGTRHILSDKPASDYAVANQGQLKNMAWAAREELAAQGHMQIAGPLPVNNHPVNALFNAWSSTTDSATDYAAANLGQLKAVAKPFYDVLYLDYPWAANGAGANDYAVANLGQLKAVFSFAVLPFDSDNDGLPDGWERKMFGDLDQGAADDFDGDGLSDSLEFTLGSSPKSQDTDGDGLPDAWEHQYALNPCDASDAGPAQGRVEHPEEPGLPQQGDSTLYEYVTALEAYEEAMTAFYSLAQAAVRMDPDKDGLSNLREHAAGTHPRMVSTDGDPYSDYEEVAYGSNPLLAASIPPVRAVLSDAGPTQMKVSTFRAEHAVGGETVTVVGSPGTVFYFNAPDGTPTPDQITVTTDVVTCYAIVYVFVPRGTVGGGPATVTLGDGSPPGAPHTVAANEWRDELLASLDPTLPAPSPRSEPPPEGVVFTAHRYRTVDYSGDDLGAPKMGPPDGSPGQPEEIWYKVVPSPSAQQPQYSDDGFNGDADLQGNNQDPGDPRDQIAVPTVWQSAQPNEPGAFKVEHSAASSSSIIGPYTREPQGTYTATNAYQSPDKKEKSGGSFSYSDAVSTLQSVSYARGGEVNGWQGNGQRGVAGHTVTSTLSSEDKTAPTISYSNPNTGASGQSAPPYKKWSASMEQVEVRLQTNKAVTTESGPVSREFVLTKTTVEEGSTTGEFIASLRLTINSGKESDACEVLSGALPAGDVMTQGGVVSLRSPAPEEGKRVSYVLQPVEVVSRDKFLAGSFDIPAGWDNLSLEFIGPDGENLGKYGDLLGGGDTKIYEKAADILGEEDIAAARGQSPDQKVWFVRDKEGSRKICFYTCFNSLGQAQIKLYFDEATAPVTVTHALVAAEDFAGVIAYVDEWVKGTSFQWEVPYEALSLPVLALASQTADDPSAAGLSPVAIASSLVSGAVITADANVPLAPDTVNLVLGSPLAGAPALGSQAALRILPLDAIQPQTPLPLEPGTVYWLASGVLYPLTDAQVTTLGEVAGSLTLAVPPPPPTPPTPPPLEGGTAYSFTGNNSGPIDNLTRAALIPFFNVVNQVEGLGSIVVGVCDGVKAGAEDDWAFAQLIVIGGVQAGSWAYESAKAELHEWKTNPVKRAAELKVIADQMCVDWVYKPAAKFWVETGNDLWKEIHTERGFRQRTWQIYGVIKGALQSTSTWTAPKDLWATMVDELCAWGDDFNARMVNGADKAHWEGVPWAKENLLEEIHSVHRYRCYSFGYTFGYLCEQVAVGFATDGVLKIAQVAAKGGMVLAANLAKRTTAAVVARGQWLKRLLAEAGAGDALLRAAYERGMVACLVEPTGPTIKEVVFEVLEKAFSNGGFNKSIYSWKHLQDDLLQRANLSKLLKQAGGETIYQRRLSQLATILGNEFDEIAAKNFAKVADEIIVIAKPDGTVDECFEAFFRAFTGNSSLMVSADVGATFSISGLSAQGKATLKKFLSDPNAGKLWEIDVPVFVGNKPAVPHNYWIRGVLAELSIYKRVYKKAGYSHAPIAEGFDFTGPKWVQIKSLGNPDGAIGAMREAIDDLIANSPGAPTPLKLHILKKPGTSSQQLDEALRAHILTLSQGNQDRLELVIEAYELVP